MRHIPRDTTALLLDVHQCQVYAILGLTLILNEVCLLFAGGGSKTGFQLESLISEAVVNYPR